MPTHLTYGAQISVEDALFSAYASENYGFVLGFPGVGLQFLDFEAGIDDDLNPNIAEIQTQGRSGPFLFHASGKNRKISFTVVFMDETRAGEAFARARILQALKLPWNRKNVEEPWVTELFPPPMLRLRIEQLDIDVKGHLTECATQYAAPLTSPAGIELGPKDQDPDFINVGGERVQNRTAYNGLGVPLGETARQLVPSYITCTCTFLVDDVGPGNDFQVDVFEIGRIDIGGD